MQEHKITDIKSPILDFNEVIPYYNVYKDLLYKEIPTYYTGNNNSYSKSKLTPKQKKSRAKNKQAKQSRKKNR